MLDNEAVLGPFHTRNFYFEILFRNTRHITPACNLHLVPYFESECRQCVKGLIICMLSAK